MVEKAHYIILSEGRIKMLKWVKKLCSKNAHPALFVRNKKVSFTLKETNWICENCAPNYA
ncbi:hypothetical protein BHL25_10785 [Bacillus cereus]|nr:hypothetical protein BHL25_10785 [Bacillus cereus]